MLVYLVNVIQPAILSEHFREYRSPIHTFGVGGEVGGEENNMVYLCTGFTMLPLHRNDGMEPKRRLAYADFYRLQIVAKKMSRDKTGGSVGFPETRRFFSLIAP